MCVSTALGSLAGSVLVWRLVHRRSLDRVVAMWVSPLRRAATAALAATASTSTAWCNQRHRDIRSPMAMNAQPQGMPLLVVGSVNADIVIQAPRLPKQGETLKCGGGDVIPGGKVSEISRLPVRIGHVSELRALRETAAVRERAGVA